jgi:hypothetical protein
MAGAGCKASLRAHDTSLKRFDTLGSPMHDFVSRFLLLLLLLLLLIRIACSWCAHRGIAC